MSQPLPGGMFIQVPPPHRNFTFIAEPHQLREQIEKAEHLADAIWRALPCFIPATAIERMSIESVGDVLMGVRVSLRNFLCCELEQKLADQLKNPLPTEEQMRAEMEKAMRGVKVKPPIEVLLQAQQKVSAIEEAIQKIEELDDDNPIKEYGSALLLPQYRMQLDQERDYLSRIQAALEEPDETPSNEASESPMSSGTESGEGTVPDEAKP
jgi:hypothetical protein